MWTKQCYRGNYDLRALKNVNKTVRVGRAFNNSFDLHYDLWMSSQTSTPQNRAILTKSLQKFHHLLLAFMFSCCIYLTNVIIYHRRASLSKQHTDLLICHCTKQLGFVTHKYEISRYHISQQPGQLLSVWLHMHWTKLYTKVMSWISDIYKCHLCMALRPHQIKY